MNVRAHIDLGLVRSAVCSRPCTLLPLRRISPVGTCFIYLLMMVRLSPAYLGLRDGLQRCCCLRHFEQRSMMQNTHSHALPRRISPVGTCFIYLLMMVRLSPAYLGLRDGLQRCCCLRHFEQRSMMQNTHSLALPRDGSSRCSARWTYTLQKRVFK